MIEVFASACRILLLLAGVYLVLAVGAHSLALSRLFPRPPLNYGLGPDYLQLTAPDGIRLAARYWPCPGAKHTLLYLHGNYEDLGTVAEYAPAFVQAGYAVFALDYRGYGHSGGTATEANVYADTRLAYDYLRTQLQLPPDRIVVYGYSLGGGPAVELARQQPVAGLVLQGAFVSAYRVMSHYPLFPGDKFTNLSKMPQLRCPVMIIHGTADNTVSFWHGKKLFEAVPGRKASLFIEGGPHTGLADYAGPIFTQELKRFTDSL